jgi:hypothetical protein
LKKKQKSRTWPASSPGDGRFMSKNSQTQRRHRNTNRWRREKSRVIYSTKTTPSFPTKRCRETNSTCHSPTLFVWLISHRSAVLFSQNKSATIQQYFSLRTNQHQLPTTS